MHLLDEGVGSQALVNAALGLVGRIALSGKADAGTVAAALRTAEGRVHTGICLDLACGIGFCAEAGAVAEMLKARERRVMEIVAVNRDRILPPCGRCRELLVQVSEENVGARVIVSRHEWRSLAELLPERWM